MLSKLNLFLAISLFIVLAGCKTNQQQAGQMLEEGLYKVMILYPNGDGKTFDMDYYQQKHMPMVAGFIGSNLKMYEIDKGISARAANEKPPYMAVGYFYVADIDAYNQSIGQNRDAIINDFKNYTNVQPMIQISQLSQVVYNKVP